MTLFLVGRVNELKKHRWEVMGIFDDEEIAEFHCTDWYDFYGPLELGKYLGEEPKEWPGCRYPVAENITKRTQRKCRKKLKSGSISC